MTSLQRCAGTMTRIDPRDRFGCEWRCTPARSPTTTMGGRRVDQPYFSSFGRGAAQGRASGVARRAGTHCVVLVFRRGRSPQHRRRSWFVRRVGSWSRKPRPSAGSPCRITPTWLPRPIGTTAPARWTAVRPSPCSPFRVTSRPRRLPCRCLDDAAVGRPAVITAEPSWNARSRCRHWRLWPTTVRRSEYEQFVSLLRAFGGAAAAGGSRVAIVPAIAAVTGSISSDCTPQVERTRPD